MPRKPSFLRGLVENRARADGEVRRYRELLVAIEERLKQAESDRDACDRLIRRVNELFDPSVIEPIRPGLAYRGGHGALRNTVSDVLKERAPDDVSTTDLVIELMLRLKVDFLTNEHRKVWIHNSLTPALKALVRKGLVERMHDPAVPRNVAGHWRWKVEAPRTLAALEAQYGDGDGDVESTPGQPPRGPRAPATPSTRPRRRRAF